MEKWETFDFSGKTATPKLSIRKGGQIGLNSAAVDRYKLNRYKFVVLKINKEDEKMGLRFTNDENEKGVRKLNIVQGGISLSAKNFIEYYGINKIKESKLDCEWDEKEEMIIAKYSK